MFKSIINNVYVLLSFLSILTLPGFTGKIENTTREENSPSLAFYTQLGSNSLPFEAFDLAYEGYLELKDSLKLNDKVISIIDFSQPSTKKRFYLINMHTKKVLYQEYVAHGKNTGVLEAKKFSNIVSSNQSSLGFFKTAETYYGKHGLALKIDGLEKGINHLARKRTIVVHQADYAEKAFIKKHGRLGRSFGCPALPSENYDEIIEQIKDGTLLFIYYPEEEYLQSSAIIN
jgi:hypothetical protein